MKYIKLFEAFTEEEEDIDMEEEEETVTHADHDEHMDEDTPESDEIDDPKEPNMTKRNLVGQKQGRDRDNLSYMPQTNYS